MIIMKYLIIRWNQHIANRLYIAYMGSQASNTLFFVWKVLGYHFFLIVLGTRDHIPGVR